MLRDRNITYDGIATVSAVEQVVVAGETLTSDAFRTFVEITLLHSFPEINQNGIAFNPKNIARSIASTENQPLNLDHQLEGNPESVFLGKNKIVGSMIRSLTAAKTDSPDIPEVAFPAKIIGVLWARVEDAQKIIESIGTGDKEYRVSMEAIRPQGGDAWYARRDGEWHYVTDITEEEFEKFQNREFDQVAMALGGDGTIGKTNFWGGGFTLTPADKKATIDSVLTASFDGECAIAAVQNTAANSSVQNKEIKMTREELIAIAADAAGFDAKVVGNDLLLTVGEKTHVNPDFYMYSAENNDGSNGIFATLTVKETSKDGMEETRRFEYDGSTDGADLAQVEAAQAKIQTPAEMVTKAVDAANVASAAKYEGFLSPEDVAKQVAEAVAAAKKGTENMDTPTKEEQAEQIATESKKAVDTAMAGRDAKDAALNARCAQIEAAEHVLTAERKAFVKTIEVGEKGDAQFVAYLASLASGREGMIKDLEDSKIEVTPQIASSLAMIDDKTSTAFIAMKQSVSSAVQPAFVPSLASNGGVTDKPTFAG